MGSIMKNKPGVGLESLVVAPVGIALCAALGAVYAFVDWLHDWGVVNPVVALVMGAAVVFVTVWSVRLAKVRGEWLGGCYGLVHAGAAVLGVFVTLWVLTGNGRGFFELHSVRMAAGQTLFGAGTWAVKGWLFAGCWVLSNLVLIFFGFAAGVAEAGSPFCTRCNARTNRVRWKAGVRGVTPDGVRKLRQGGVRALLELVPGTGGGETLRLKLRTCKCGAVASLNAEREADEGPSTDIVIGAEPVASTRLAKLFDWAEAHPGVIASPRPSLERMGGRARGPREPFVADPTPPDGEHRSYARLHKSLGASDSYANNDFTGKLRKALDQGDFFAVDEALAMVKSHNNRANVFEAAADWSRRPFWLDDWEEEDATSPTRLTVEGIWKVKEAWMTRGNAWVPKDFAAFELHLQTATRLLLEATAARPEDPVPYAWLIYASKGLQNSLEESFAFCKKAVKLDKGFRLPYSFFLDAAAPKWGGSRDQMLSFARKAFKAAPEGSTVPVVIAEAHLEMAGEMAREQGDDLSAFEAYLCRPEVAHEISEANRHCFMRHIPTMDTPRTRVYFAYALWKAGRPDAAAEHLRVIGTSTPYGPFASRVLFASKETITHARKACGVR